MLQFIMSATAYIKSQIIAQRSKEKLAGKARINVCVRKLHPTFNNLNSHLTMLFFIYSLIRIINVKAFLKRKISGTCKC